MTRTVVAVCFLVALAAGFTLGKRTVETPAPVASHEHRCGIEAELNLTPDQRQKMHQFDHGHWGSRPAGRGRHGSGGGDRPEKDSSVYWGDGPDHRSNEQRVTSRPT